MFENFAEGILDEAEYQFAKKKYDDEAAEIEKKLTVEKAKKVQLDDILSLSNEWLVAIHKAENVTEIDVLKYREYGKERCWDNYYHPKL